MNTKSTISKLIEDVLATKVEASLWVRNPDEINEETWAVIAGMRYEADDLAVAVKNLRAKGHYVESVFQWVTDEVTLETIRLLY